MMVAFSNCSDTYYNGMLKNVHQFFDEVFLVGCMLMRSVFVQYDVVQSMYC